MSLIRTLPSACGSSLRCMTVAPYLSLFFSFCPFCLASKKEAKFEAGKARKINEPRPRGRERLLIFLYLSIFDSRERENTLPDIPLDCIGISAGYIRFIHTSNKYGFSPCSKVFRIKKSREPKPKAIYGLFFFPRSDKSPKPVPLQKTLPSTNSP